MEVLTKLGLFPGRPEDLHKADESNPEGYWENDRIIEVNQAMLSTYNLHDYEIRSLPSNWREHPQAPAILARLDRVIRASYDGHAFWGWKDPRTTLLLPLVHEVLGKMGVRPHFILAVRNPIDVANSVVKRDGIPFETGLGLWIHYALTALRELPPADTHVSFFEEVLSDPRESLEHVVASLDVPPPEEEQWLAARKSIRRELAHSSSTCEAVDGVHPKLVGKIYRLLEKIRRQPEDYRSGAFGDEIQTLWDTWQTWELIRSYVATVSSPLTFLWPGANGAMQTAGGLMFGGDMKWFGFEQEIPAPPGTFVGVSFGPHPGVVYLAQCHLKTPDGRTERIAFQQGPGGQVSDAGNGMIKVAFAGQAAHIAFQMPRAPGTWSFHSNVLADLTRNGAAQAAQAMATALMQRSTTPR